MRAFSRIAAMQLLCVCMSIPIPSAADDLKISQLEQDVRELKRQVDQQGRRLDTFEREFAQSRATLPPGIERNKASALDGASGMWLNIANWNKVKPGMAELDVIRTLGPPTSLRKSKEGEQQTLFYAMEIGGGSFLTGSIKMNDHRVVDVQKPALK